MKSFSDMLTGIKSREPVITSIATARQMLLVLQRKWRKADALIMATDVCDFRPQRQRNTKIRREGQKAMTLRLIPMEALL